MTSRQRDIHLCGQFAVLTTEHRPAVPLCQAFVIELTGIRMSEEGGTAVRQVLRTCHTPTAGDAFDSCLHVPGVDGEPTQDRLSAPLRGQANEA